MANEESPLRRGEAAYRAQRDDVAKRNDAARKAARERNEGEQRRAAATARAQELQERRAMADSVE